MFAERYKRRIAAQRQAGLYRSPPEISKRDGKYLDIGGHRVLNFASNDYLGLGCSETLKKKVANNFQKFNASSSSSRLVSGNYSAISQAEKEYAKHFGYDEALFFPSGYQANIGILSTFFEKGDTIICDKHVHASTVEGMTLSGAGFKGYNHNSMSHLKKRLEANGQDQMAVLTESLFSMDGDLLDTGAFDKVKKEYKFLCIVDEAHAFGVLGDKGCGMAGNVADIALGTFGKALGLFGAFVLLPEGFKEYLFNFASPLIYTTALPEAHASAAVDLLEIISERDDLRAHLKQVSQHMKKGLSREGFQVTGDAHILAVRIGEEHKSVAVARGLLDRGIFVLPARFPTVPIRNAILRVSMTAMHTDKDVANFIRILSEVSDKIE